MLEVFCYVVQSWQGPSRKRTSLPKNNKQTYCAGQHIENASQTGNSGMFVYKLKSQKFLIVKNFLNFLFSCCYRSLVTPLLTGSHFIYHTDAKDSAGAKKQFPFVNASTICLTQWTENHQIKDSRRILMTLRYKNNANCTIKNKIVGGLRIVFFIIA